MSRAMLALGACLLAASAGVQAIWARSAAALPPVPAVQYLRSPETARRIALSYDLLLADVYWMRALQEFGSTRLRAGGQKTYAHLYPYLDLATSLDPHFNVAYRFGAIFLSETPPGGPGRPDQAIALLEKGIAANPDRWEYFQDIGFVYYWWRQDYRTAADWFDRGAQLSGAPWWLGSLAATTLASGGDRRQSRVLWQTMLRTSENDWLRRDAARRLAQLDALDQIDALTQVVDRARAAGVTPPWSWAVLFERGFLSMVPDDPNGEPYTIDLNTGHVDVARSSPLFPLPTSPSGTPSSDVLPSIAR